MSWMFAKKGYILIDKSQTSEEELLDLVLEAGAEDMKLVDQNFEVTTDVQNLEAVKKALAEKGIATQIAEMSMIPSSSIKITSANDAKQILSLVESLEEHDMPSIDDADTENPLQHVMHHELQEHISAAIEKLSIDQRAVFVLRTSEGLSYQEISEQLGISTGTVMSRLSRAREKLKAMLSPVLNNEMRGES